MTKKGILSSTYSGRVEAHGIGGHAILRLAVGRHGDSLPQELALLALCQEHRIGMRPAAGEKSNEKEEATAPPRPKRPHLEKLVARGKFCNWRLALDELDALVPSPMQRIVHLAIFVNDVPWRNGVAIGIGEGRVRKGGNGGGWFANGPRARVPLRSMNRLPTLLYVRQCMGLVSPVRWLVVVTTPSWRWWRGGRIVAVGMQAAGHGSCRRAGHPSFPCSSVARPNAPAPPRACPG